jgi:hypothetical protein
VPLSGFRPDDRAGVELAAIDPHRAPEAAADLEGGLDDGVAGEAWRDRLEISDFTGRDAVGHSVPPRRSVRAQGSTYMGWNGPAGIGIRTGGERVQPAPPACFQSNIGD